MRGTSERKEKEPYYFPHIGQRIIKTTVAVFICLLINMLRGNTGAAMSAEACITAIICIQPYVQDTRQYAVSRFAGTLLGAGIGLVMLILLYRIPVLGASQLFLYCLMAAGVMLTLYITVMLRKPDLSALAAISFLCVIITFPDIDTPLLTTVNRILDVLIGTFSAVIVNAFRLPRTRNHGYVFFVRSKDLIPDRFSNISPAVLFRLNYLYNDGARISLITEHAPAFFTQQMSSAKLNTPMIVMDGAAIFDIEENRYLGVETIREEDSDLCKDLLESLRLSYFIYTVRKNRTCIFHHGDFREEEKKMYDRMRRSPYRDYLEEEVYDPSEIVYYKVIVKTLQSKETEMRLKEILPADRLRYAIRPQAGTEDLSGIYIYSAAASVDSAMNRLMILLRQEDPSLVPMEITSRTGYRTEYDAMHLLHNVEKYYEPVLFFGKHS